jgi:PIN domain nuclease of toxin-antitoxin system
MSAVLDASAILAVLFEEPGAEIIRGVIAGSLVSAVNYSETVSKAIDRERGFDDTIALLAHMGFVLVPHDLSLARRAGQLRLSTKRFGLSIGDRACLALAERERLPVYTTDRSWANLDLSIQVQVIR